jgi:hypothetical protein
VRHAFGEIDRVPDRRFGFGQLDHAACLDAARLDVAEPDHFDRMAAPAQDLLRRLWL